MDNNNNIFRTEFLPWTFKFGKWTDLLGVVLCFGPCIALLLMGIHPSWGAFAAGFAIQFPLMLAAQVREPFTYFTVLGAPGTYMSCLSGNISNLRVPCATVAQQAAGVQEGSEQGTIVATIGIAVSTFVNILLLTVAVVAGAWILEQLPDIVVSALNLLLPALFAALMANYAFQKPKLAIIVIPACFILYALYAHGALNFIPSLLRSAIMPLVCSFGSMFLGVWMSKKGKI